VRPAGGLQDAHDAWHPPHSIRGRLARVLARAAEATFL
jgi:hypothetical protein